MFARGRSCRRQGFTLIEALVVVALMMILVWVGLGAYRRHHEILQARSVLAEAMKYKEKVDTLSSARGIPKYELFFAQEGWNNPQQMGVWRGFAYYLGYAPCGNGVDCLYFRIQGDGEVLAHAFERTQELGMACNFDQAGGVLECQFEQ